MKKDKGAWTIPKGEYERSEMPLVAAQREFEEETGFQAAGEFLDIGTIKQKDRKSTRLNSSHSRRSRMPSSA